MRGGCILAVSAADPRSLFSAYIPFVRGGAIFITLDLEIEMGEGVLVILQLPDSPERQLFFGRTVWVTPAASRDEKFCHGIGVQIPDAELQHRISTVLSRLSPQETANIMPRWLA